MINYFKQYSRVIWVHALGQTIAAFVAIMLLPFLTLHLYEQFQDIRITTLLIGIQPLTEVVLTLTIGGLVDRIGRRPIIIYSMGIQALAATGFIFAESIWAFAACSFLIGLGRFVYIPAARAQIADLAKPEKQAETFALLNTAKSIGALIGPILGSYLFHQSSNLIFIVSSFVLFCYFLLTIKLIPESLPELCTLQKVNGERRFRWKEHRILGWIMISALPLSFFHSQMETTWPVYLKEHMVNYLIIFSTLETIGTITYLLFEILLVNKTSKWTIDKAIALGYLLYSFSAIGFGLFKNIWLLSLAQILLCTGAIIALNHLQKMVSQIAPVHFRARYFALYGLHWDISRTIGPFLGGIMMAKLGGRSLFLYRSDFHYNWRLKSNRGHS